MRHYSLIKMCNSVLLVWILGAPINHFHILSFAFFKCLIQLVWICLNWKSDVYQREFELKYGIRSFWRMKQKISVLFWSTGVDRNVKCSWGRKEDGRKCSVSDACLLVRNWPVLSWWKQLFLCATKFRKILIFSPRCEGTHGEAFARGFTTLLLWLHMEHTFFLWL